MFYICTNKNPDGSHAFQVGGNLEDGWAVVPDGMEIPASFPFVNIETALVTHPAVADVTENIVIIPGYTRMEVTSMTEGEEIPVEITEDDPSNPADTVYDELAQAYKEGVQSA